MIPVISSYELPVGGTGRKLEHLEWVVPSFNLALEAKCIILESFLLLC